MFFLPSLTPGVRYDGKPQENLIFSASDLVNAAFCEFSTLQILDEKLGRLSLSPHADDAMLAHTAELGDAHETAILESYRARYGTFDSHAGCGVYEVSTQQGYSASELAEKQAETLAALKAGADVVFQGAFFDGEFYGRADFLVKQADGSYAVFDTKLARQAKVTALLQLAAYAEQLTKNGVPATDTAGLILGTGEQALFDISGIRYVLADRRTRFKQIVEAHGAPGIEKVSWWKGSTAVDSIVRCGRCERCVAEIHRHRDVLMTAGLTIKQGAFLAANYGIRTIDELAQLEPAPGRELPSTVRHLKQQAAMQTGRLEADGEGRFLKDGAEQAVAYKVVDDAPVLKLPLANPGDIFFDFEGDPLWQATDGSWGLEYLFGVLEAPEKTSDAPVFKPFWAHTRAQERAALTDFLAYVAERRQRFPGMRIYHYANYEKRALRALAASHGTGEDSVDQLLRENVLVDLFDTVRAALRISENSYSIKRLEPLYMGDHLRTGDVKDAGASVVAYAQYCQARDRGDSAEAQHILESIADYNEYDCLSTLKLRNWLLSLVDRNAQAEYGIEAAAELLEASDKQEEEVSPAERKLQAYLDSLDAETELSADEQAIAMVASATGYHRRERKQFWWDHFDRLSAPVEDWADTRNTVIFDRIAVAENWHLPPRKRTQIRVLEARARMAEGSSLKEGESQLFLMYGAPLPDYFETMLMEQASKYAASNGTGQLPSLMDRSGHFRGKILDLEKLGTDAGFITLRVRIQESLAKDAEAYDQLPLIITPAQPLPTQAQENALTALAHTVGEALPHIPQAAGLDLLRKVAPRLSSGYSLPTVDEYRAEHGSMATAEAIYAAVSDLDSSYLAVQGPPGSGKTFVGSKVISRLLNEGWRIGVVAQSHAVIDNMLAGCIKNGKVSPQRIAKSAKAGKEPNEHGWQELKSSDIAAFLEQPGVLFGGTAWDFSNASKFADRQLDLLVIDEAGQYSLANTLAVARASKNLLLLGDPQQLPQVTQGSHPYPVDESALGWLSAGYSTLPAHLGYFLDVTWRMHPQLTAPVSQLSYDNKLHSAPAGSARHLDYFAPGVYSLPLAHTGNTTSSVEEAHEIVGLAQRFIGTPWTPDTTAPVTRELEPHDILVVAAYNAQVDLITELLEKAGLEDVRVGTVDKFQGQEAPVVLVSMAASNAGDSARGAEFLLSPNRLNVAISRGKWCAVLVHSTSLTNYLPASTDALMLLGKFVRLLNQASPWKSIK